ncbi:hypothetical protein OSCI_3190005 [Kamptonema sp. PCC 6506]|nr:hypothetical protein OSCI_3190005 [Kamptonema sp. PCC 6506]
MDVRLAVGSGQFNTACDELLALCLIPALKKAFFQANPSFLSSYKF